jgi:hypothetical protein
MRQCLASRNSLSSSLVPSTRSLAFEAGFWAYALLVKGATDVALHGSVVLEEMPGLSPMEQTGGLKHLLKVFWVCTALARLRSGYVVGRGCHLLPVTLPVLVLLVVVSLG